MSFKYWKVGLANWSGDRNYFDMTQIRCTFLVKKYYQCDTKYLNTSSVITLCICPIRADAEEGNTCWCCSVHAGMLKHNCLVSPTGQLQDHTDPDTTWSELREDMAEHCRPPKGWSEQHFSDSEKREASVLNNSIPGTLRQRMSRFVK